MACVEMCETCTNRRKGEDPDCGNSRCFFSKLFYYTSLIELSLSDYYEEDEKALRAKAVAQK